ncbi:MAG: 3-deoxy-manno-octulosonate cytidylyltransferase [Chitinophagaceae bacterium]|nr:3-deoxy-manno-octulosonate cytidylyltransferase [Chitinophagaceae bacterium]
MKILVIVPARFASTRFPGKPLAMIGGKSMIQRVFEQVLKCTTVDEILVATDDERIETAVKLFGGKVMMTSVTHLSGTSRCAEVVQNLDSDFEIIINVQGDEPFIDPEQIDLLVKCFADPMVSIATLIKRITKHEDLTNPNIVKAVIGEQYQALYFSRSALPYFRGVEEHEWAASTNYYKHIGIYGYRTKVLQQLIQLPVNNLEEAESLEQLRWLANGYRIQTAVTESETISIDTPEDLEIANAYLKEHSK